MATASLDSHTNFSYPSLFYSRSSLPTKQEELKAWRIATVVLVALAAVVFLIQHFVGQVFDVVLEVCVFYIPALAIVALFLYFRTQN
jgi:uncharacterized membrane protein